MSDYSNQNIGPANPFNNNQTGLKRKNNVLTGFAEETFISNHTFRSKHRAIERRGGPERENQTGAQIKAEAAKIRSTRQKKGDATIPDGEGSYIGPWARYKRDEYEEVAD